MRNKDVLNRDLSFPFNRSTASVAICFQNILCNSLNGDNIRIVNDFAFYRNIIGKINSVGNKAVRKLFELPTLLKIGSNSINITYLVKLTQRILYI